MGGEVEILGGKAAGVVGDEGELDAVVADVDVGVVAGLLGELSDAVHKSERVAEGSELEGFHELAVFDLPAVELGQPGFDVIGGKWGHGFSPYPGFLGIGFPRRLSLFPTGRSPIMLPSVLACQGREVPGWDGRRWGKAWARRSRLGESGDEVFLRGEAKDPGARGACRDPSLSITTISLARAHSLTFPTRVARRILL